MSDRDGSSYSEPESGTDLDDPNLREQDDQELMGDDEIEIDEQAELEARQVPLGPAQRRAAERELAMRDMQERNVALPYLLRQDMQRQYENENLANQLRELQLQTVSEDQGGSQWRETPNAVSVTSDQSRLFAFQVQRLRVEIPQNDAEFKQTLRDLRAQPTAELLEHSIIKVLYFLKTAQKQDVSSALGRIPVPKYVERANELLGDQTRSSLEIEASDIAEFNSDLLDFLVESPALALHFLDAAVTRFIRELEPAHEAVHSTIKARITVSTSGKALELLPEALRPIPLSKLNTSCVGRLICARGVVVQRTARQARLVQLYVRCLVCGNVMGPINMQTVTGVIGVPWSDPFKRTSQSGLPKRCLNAACGSPRLTVSHESIYEDVVIVTMQEGQDDVENGHVPHRREVVLSGDLVSRGEPGSVLRVTGVYAATPDNVPGLYATYATHIEANGVAFDGPGANNYGKEPGVDVGVSGVNDVGDFENGPLSAGLDGGEIRALQQLPKLFKNQSLEDLLLRSLAPSLGRSEAAKRALLCALIGGVSRRAGPGGPRTRGDIHLLLLGDPGVAKSQLLRAAGRVAPKAVLATGRGASAAGLTVAVRRDANGTFSLQAGALVLASGGVCLVDELDKMTQVDRVALHQAMEQQEVSIAKAGIIATLPARAAVVAAANPNSQRYNVNLPLQHNIDIGDALLSRFDLVVIMRDEVDREKDADLAKFIIESHVRAAGGAQAAEGAGRGFGGAGRAGVPAGSSLGAESGGWSQGGADAGGYSPNIDESLSIPAVIGYLQHFQQEAAESAILPSRVLRAYISLCRTVEPAITQDVVDRVSSFYHAIRGLGATFAAQDAVHGTDLSGAPRTWSAPTQRAIGTAFRVIEAHAKMHLRTQISEDDIVAGLGLLAELFIQQQKKSLQRRTEQAVQQYIFRLHRRAGNGPSDSQSLPGSAAAFAVLDDCFRQLNVLVQQGVTAEARVTPEYLRAQCSRLGVQLAEAFFRLPELENNYRLVYGQGDQLEAIYQRNL